MYNAGKYFSKLLPPLVIALATAGCKHPGGDWYSTWLIVETVATLYCLIWDFYMDWGLFRSWEKGTYMLRPKIGYPAKFFYFAMCTNALLRFFWVLKLPNYDKKSNWFEELEFLTFFGIMAELIRRMQWSLLRVENEFFNNFEQYRTIPIIPNLMDDVSNTLQNTK